MTGHAAANERTTIEPGGDERERIDRVTELTGPQQDQVRALVTTAAGTDGFPSLNEAALLALRHTDPAATHLLVSHGPTLVAYAQVLDHGADATAVLLVSPPHRRHGIGSALLTELRATARSPVSLWAMGDTEAAQALAASTGLRRTRELLIMTRPTAEPVAEPTVPAGTRIRAFVVGQDEQQWLGVNARAFAHHPEQGALTRADLEERIAEPWFDAPGFLLAARGEQIVGFHWTKQHPGQRGEVYVLGVDPSAGGEGLGTVLLRSGLRHLAARGDTEVLLYVEADQERAVALYRRHGFAVASRDVMYTVPV